MDEFDIIPMPRKTCRNGSVRCVLPGRCEQRRSHPCHLKDADAQPDCAQSHTGFSNLRRFETQHEKTGPVRSRLSGWISRGARGQESLSALGHLRYRRCSERSDWCRSRCRPSPSPPHQPRGSCRAHQPVRRSRSPVPCRAWTDCRSDPSSSLRLAARCARAGRHCQRGIAPGRDQQAVDRRSEKYSSAQENVLVMKLAPSGTRHQRSGWKRNQPPTLSFR